MKNQHNKVVTAVLPFLFLLGSLMVIFILSRLEPNTIDQDWRTRQLIIGLFIFTGVYFLPSLLKVSFASDFPFIKMNLSHHSYQGQDSHEMNFKGFSVCVGCFGTSISILFGNFFLLVYFFRSLENQVDSLVLPLFLVGISLILVTYSRYFFMFPPRIRLFQHSALFVGLALMIIACDIRYQSAFLMVFLLPSWILFLFIRIQLSKIEHKTL